MGWGAASVPSRFDARFSELERKRTSKVGSGLVGGGRGGGRLPSGDVDGLEVLGHLSDLDRVEAVSTSGSHQ